MFQMLTLQQNFHLYLRPEYIRILIGILVIRRLFWGFMVCGNTTVADIYQKKKGKYTNLVAGVHGISAIAGTCRLWADLKEGPEIIRLRL